MKLLTILFSLYFISLSLVPCSDVSAGDHTETVDKDCGGSEDNHQDCIDFCSPFCSCSCCGSTMAYFLPDLITVKSNISFEKHTSVFVQQVFSSYNHSFWQPPKI